jgi:hypothetical protein
MTTDANAAGDTTLSIERAAGLLGSAREKEDDAPGTSAGDDNENSSADTTAADRAQSENDARGESSETKEDESSEANEDSQDDAEAETPGTPALSPPRWWNKQAKERFASLPPELQAVVHQQEDNRERVVQKAKQDAAEARKLAEAHSTEMSQRLQLIDRLAPEAAQLFAGRWANVDWSKLPDQVGAEEAFKLKAQYEKERDTLSTLHAMQQTAQEEGFKNFVATESEKLRTVAPELTDETHGPARKQELGRFLLAQGFQPERIQYMSADEAGIAYDAMRWRQAQSKAQALSKKQPAQAAKPPVKPTAAARTSPSRSADDAARRLKATGRIDDAIALLNARG